MFKVIEETPAGSRVLASATRLSALVAIFESHECIAVEERLEDEVVADIKQKHAAVATLHGTPDLVLAGGMSDLKGELDATMVASACVPLDIFEGADTKPDLVLMDPPDDDGDSDADDDDTDLHEPFITGADPE